MYSTKKNDYYFSIASLLVIIFNYIFHSYVLLCSTLQIGILAWALILLANKFNQEKKFIISCFSIGLIIFCAYLFKGQLAKTWTFFIKLICIFMFVCTLDRENLTEYLNIYSITMLFFSTVVITISFISMVFVTDISQVPSLLSPISVYIYESGICKHIEPRYIGFFGNSNPSGIFASLTIFTSIYLIIKRSKYTFLAIFNIIIQFSIIIATASRGSILAVALFILSFPLIYICYSFSSYSENKRKVILLILSILLILIICFAILCIQVPNLYNVFASLFRFSIPENPTFINKIKAILDSFTKGSGRDYLIIENYYEFKQSPIKGASYQSLYDSKQMTVHNGFLFMLFFLGIPMFCFIIALFIIVSIAPIIKSLIYRKNYSSNELLLISFATTSILCSFFYNCFEVLIGPMSNDGYTILFLICSGILFNLTRKRSAKRDA